MSTKAGQCRAGDSAVATGTSEAGSTVCRTAGRTAVVVQMRLGSSRLPAKALLPLASGTLADAVMERLRGIPAELYILASDHEGCRALYSRAREHGFETLAGPTDDVLARFVLAIRQFGLGRVIRATGDNPFVSVELANIAVAEADATGADYVGLTGMPLGMGVEVVKAEALVDADSGQASAYDREHVCPYLYNNPGRYAIHRPQCPAGYRMPDSKVTVDTIDDYDAARELVMDLGYNPPDAAILHWLAGRTAS